MLKFKKVAVTGGTASGKSTVCKMFHDLGAVTVDADAIVHELLSSDTDLGQRIIRLLGNEVLEYGKLSRRLIADKVFKDPEILHAFEKLLHPAVLRKIEQAYERACQSGKTGLFVAEVPLLYEIGADASYDAVVVVLSEREKSRERFRLCGHSEEEYEGRMKRQWHPDKKAKLASYVIRNNGTMDDLFHRVNEIYNILNPKEA